MKVHGIDFAHRRARDLVHASREYAEFTTFAAMCEVAGVARAVRSVCFDTKSMCFSIAAAPEVENTLDHQQIATCAMRSLPQFILFGAYHCRPQED